MKQQIKALIANQIISGSAIIVSGGVIANALNFLFNLFMSRNLAITDYGILASLVSLITLFTIPAGAVTPTIVRFGAEYFARGELDMVRGLFYKIFRFTFSIGFIILVSFIIFRNVIGNFFNIESGFLIIIAGITIFIAYIGTINSGLLQAKLMFLFISIINIISNCMKLLVGAGLVLLGFQVSGGLLGFSIAYLVPYLLSFIPFRFLFSRSIKSPPISNLELIKYGAPSAIALFALSSFISTDIILVKHFFSGYEAGLYSGLSLVGRVIYFLTAPIGTVMFPIIVQKHTKNEEYGHIFKIALVLVLLPSIAATIFYFLFPTFVIHIFFAKKDYLPTENYLGLFGIFTTVFSVTSIITNYFLSIKKTAVAYPVVIGAGAQAIGIWLFHNSFVQIIMISIVTVSFIFISEIGYYVKIHGKKT